MAQAGCAVDVDHFPAKAFKRDGSAASNTFHWPTSIAPACQIRERCSVCIGGPFDVREHQQFLDLSCIVRIKYGRKNAFCLRGAKLSLEELKQDVARSHGLSIFLPGTGGL